MQTIYHFYADPQHSWLKVQTRELDRLGVRNQISRYSYLRGEYSYLEEDLDAGVFLEAKRERGESVEFREHHTNYQSKIRNYCSYVG